jgi:hypothetical protein
MMIQDIFSGVITPSTTLQRSLEELNIETKPMDGSYSVKKLDRKPDFDHMGFTKCN